MDHIFTYVIYWMHQRGDTIGATRLLSSQRWKSLPEFSKNCEKPAVLILTGKCDPRGITEICPVGGVATFYNISSTLTLPKSRVRSFESIGLITGVVHKFYTIGSIEDISGLFAINHNHIPDLPFDTKHVKTMYRTFYNTPLIKSPFWNTKNVTDFGACFADSPRFEQISNWHFSKAKDISGMLFGTQFKDLINVPLWVDKNTAFEELKDPFYHILDYMRIMTLFSPNLAYGN